MKSHKKQNKDLYIWLGVGLGVLLLVTLLVVIPNANRNYESSQPTNTTNHTEDTAKPTNTTTESKPESTKPNSTPEPEPTTQEPTTPTPTQTAPSSTPPQQTTTCYHEEAGRCWDDLEDEAYSAGAYDAMYGYYGATLDYPDDCDTLCRDILEDAYEEGWADASY